jgi:hypothetical protein
MVKLVIYYDPNCEQCEKLYLPLVREYCSYFGIEYEEHNVDQDPVMVANTLFKVRKLGYVIDNLPFFVIEDGNHTVTYDGFLNEESLKYVLSKYE